MPKQLVKEIHEYLKMKDLSCYINKIYITGLHEIYLNDGAIYFVKILYRPTKDTLLFIKETELTVKLLHGKTVLFDNTVDVASIDLMEDEGELFVALETVLVDSPLSE